MQHEIAVPLWTLLPFFGILLCIAIAPLAAPHFWETNRNKGVVAALFSLPIVAYLLFAAGSHGSDVLIEKALEYVSFICLLGSLFVVSGGIHIGGSLSGTPLINTFALALGGVLTNLIGTTGASVLLIRPILRANRARERKAHIVVFFIFVVSNCGGMLTPLGDPPLFLGFLKGVPFEWTLRLWKPWLLVNGLLLLIFSVWDQVVLNREEREREGSQLEEVQVHEPLRVVGLHNVAFLLAIVACIFGAGRGLGNAGEPWPVGVQEGLMLGLALGSYFSTRRSIHRENRFSFDPIIEVAVLFAGIFATMAPVLLYLNQNAASLGLTEPWQFYWVAGGLSSFLDNAPTYLTFAAVASGLMGVPVEGRYLAELLNRGPEAVRLLEAVAMGSVMMGAITYIGNGPNFMVKAIAEDAGVAMPSFFGYMAYSITILIPIFLIVTIVFLR